MEMCNCRKTRPKPQPKPQDTSKTTPKKNDGKG